MIDFFIKNLWLWKCGMEEKKEIIEIEELKKSEWSDEFENLMRNRLIFGAFRYGKLNPKNKVKYNRVKSCISRLKKYDETGNKEHLVDVANLCLCEFVECHHPKAHFKSIDDGEHMEVKL